MKPKLPPIRFWIGVMIFMTTFTNYMMRSNISVSIVVMIKETSKGNQTEKIPCESKKPENTSKAAPQTKYEPTYNWNAQEKNLILAAYFHGYMVTSLPAGSIAEWIGPFHVIFWASVVSAALTGLTPLSAKGGIPGIYSCRFLSGVLGGLVYPAVNFLIAQLAPPKEKGKFLAALMGNTLGTVVTWSLVGFISEAMASWQWGFYILVIIMGVYCLAFFFLVTDTPEKHRCISEAEKNYIQEAQQGALSKKKKGIPPYWQIFKSLPFWALTICQFGNLWGLNLILVYAPSFMAKYLGFNIRNSGFLSSLPYLARLIASQIFGILGDWMRKKDFMTLTKLRKFFIIFSHLIPAGTLFLILAVKCSHVGVIALLVLNQAFNGAVVVGHLINPQDLAPNFAGTIYGIMNFVASTTGFIVPPIIGALEHGMGITLQTSQIIYSIGGGMFALSGLIFMLFGSGQIQSWNWALDEAPPEEPKDN